MRNLGAEITYFSPISDNCIPDGISGIVLGGGFPEVMADKLNSNQSMLKSIKKAGKQGYSNIWRVWRAYVSHKSITGYKKSKKHFRMVGLVDAKNENDRETYAKLYKCGYEFTLRFGNIENMRGHEFHYSQIEELSSGLQICIPDETRDWNRWW